MPAVQQHQQMALFRRLLPLFLIDPKSALSALYIAIESFRNSFDQLRTCLPVLTAVIFTDNRM
eukprot:11579999-Karenia_brevis.AAC.1